MNDQRQEICVTTWSSRLVCAAKDYQADLQAVILSLPNIMTARPLKIDHKTQIAIISLQNKPIIVKRYPMKNFLYALKRALVPSRAAHCWRSAKALLNYRISTPTPIAFYEKRFGPFRREAYFIYEYIDGVTAKEYFKDANYITEAQQLIVHKMAVLFQQLQQSSLSHRDLKTENFIIANNQVYLIDLDAMRYHVCASVRRAKQAKDRQRFLANWPVGSVLREKFEQALKS